MCCRYTNPAQRFEVYDERAPFSSNRRSRLREVAVAMATRIVVRFQARATLEAQGESPIP